MFIVDRVHGTFNKIPPSVFLTVCASHGDWPNYMPEENQIQWISQTFTDKEGIAVDIGAHCGTWTTVMAQYFQHVYSFEPNRKVFRNLSANLALKNLTNVTEHMVGIGDREENLTYKIRSDEGGGNGFADLGKRDENETNTCILPVKTLDSFNLQNVKLIKIDVEGFELQVLKGARETIRRCKPALALEVWSDEREKEGVPSIRLREELYEYVQNELQYILRSVTGHEEMQLCTPM